MPATTAVPTAYPGVSRATLANTYQRVNSCLTRAETTAAYAREAHGGLPRTPVGAGAVSLKEEVAALVAMAETLHAHAGKLRARILAAHEQTTR